MYSCWVSVKQKRYPKPSSYIGKVPTSFYKFNPKHNLFHGPQTLFQWWTRLYRSYRPQRFKFPSLLRDLIWITNFTVFGSLNKLLTIWKKLARNFTLYKVHNPLKKSFSHEKPQRWNSAYACFLVKPEHFPSLMLGLDHNLYYNNSHHASHCQSFQEFVAFVFPASFEMAFSPRADKYI